MRQDQRRDLGLVRWPSHCGTGHGASPTCEVIPQESLGPCCQLVCDASAASDSSLRNATGGAPLLLGAVGNIPGAIDFGQGCVCLCVCVGVFSLVLSHHVGQESNTRLFCGKAAMPAPALRSVACPPPSRRISLAGPPLSTPSGGCRCQRLGLVSCLHSRTKLHQVSVYHDRHRLPASQASLRKTGPRTNKYPISSDTHTRQPWASEHSSSP